MTAKDRILRALERAGGQAVSGQMLADELGVSREAVWKGIQALRQEGHVIEAATNRGYRLAQDGARLSADAIRACRTGELADAPVFVYDQLDSTNTEAKRLALSGAPHGTLVLADGQTAGRGRRGHAFFSPARTGLYMSALLRVEAGPEDASRFTLAAAVAVCDGIEAELGIRPQIKWVNDGIWQGKKVAGLLTEAVTDFESGLTELVIIGIGVNLNPPEAGFPEAISGTAGALTQAQVDRNHLAARLSDALFAALALPEAQLLARYRKDCVTPGRVIRFQQNGRAFTGRALSVRDDGGLLVRLEDGTERTLYSGEVSMQSDGTDGG